MAIKLTIQVYGHLAGDIDQPDFLCLNIAIGIDQRNLTFFLLVPGQYLFLPANNNWLAD